MVPTGSRGRLIWKRDQDSISALSLAADGNLLAIGHRDLGQVGVWDMGSGSARSTIAMDEPVKALALNTGGTMLAAGRKDGSVGVWTTIDGREVATLSHGGIVSAVSFAPDGTLLASGDAGRVVKVWPVPEL